MTGLSRLASGVLRVLGVTPRRTLGREAWLAQAQAESRREMDQIKAALRRAEIEEEKNAAEPSRSDR